MRKFYVKEDRMKGNKFEQKYKLMARRGQLPATLLRKNNDSISRYLAVQHYKPEIKNISSN